MAELKILTHSEIVKLSDDRLAQEVKSAAMAADAESRRDLLGQEAMTLNAYLDLLWAEQDARDNLAD